MWVVDNAARRLPVALLIVTKLAIKGGCHSQYCLPLPSDRRPQFLGLHFIAGIDYAKQCGFTYEIAVHGSQAGPSIPVGIDCKSAAAQCIAFIFANSGQALPDWIET